MMNGGKSSEDWDKLSLQDVKLLIVDHYAKEERQLKVMQSAVNQALFGKKKSNYGRD